MASEVARQKSPNYQQSKEKDRVDLASADFIITITGVAICI